MTSYPTGVQQDQTAPGGIPNYQPVEKDNWYRFGTQADADSAFQAASALLWKPRLYVPTTGMYSQYIYLPPSNGEGIRCHVIAGGASDADGFMAVQEYAGWLWDRNLDPLEGIDQYVAGQAHVLKVQRITATLGQLYWAAD